MGSHYAVKACGFDGQPLTVRFATKKGIDPQIFAAMLEGERRPRESEVAS